MCMSVVMCSSMTEAILGYNFTDVDLIYSHLHSLDHIPTFKLPHIVSQYHPALSPSLATASIPYPRFQLAMERSLCLEVRSEDVMSPFPRLASLWSKILQGLTIVYIFL